MSERETEQGVGGAIAALSWLLLPPGGTQRALETIALLAPRVVTGCAIASVSLLRFVSGDPPTTVMTVAVSDEQARGLDQLQLDTGQGPCLDAIRTGRQVVVDAFAEDPRYASFGALARGTGMNSCYSLPVAVSGETVGSLNLYGRSAHAYGRVPDDAGVRLAEQAGVIVLTAIAHDRTVQLADKIRAAVESRAAIEQAKGIIIAQSGTDADGAFDILRRTSQRDNIKVRELARQIVQRAGRHPQ